MIHTGVCVFPEVSCQEHALNTRFIHTHVYTRAHREGETDRERVGAHRNTNTETEYSR